MDELQAAWKAWKTEIGLDAKAEQPETQTVGGPHA
jgi:hypothetical protein